MNEQPPASSPVLPAATPPSWRPGVHESALETPFWRVDDAIVGANLERMAALARDAGVRLRPHVKTHKIPAVARRQIALGARGIAVAKPSEAEVMAAAGIHDVMVVYAPYDAHKRSRIVRLAQAGVDVSVVIDDARVAADLDAACAAADVTVGVLVEVNVDDPTGRTGRCGVTVADAPTLARAIASHDHLEFRGILGYRGIGWLYAPDARSYTRDDLQRHADEEASLLHQVAEAIRADGTPVRDVVAGSTPTAPLLAGSPGITEIQPGEYVFYGGTHVGPGVASLADCALSVVVTVVSTPAPGRAVVDAGSKTLSGEIKPDALPNLRMKGLGIVRDPVDRTPLDGVTLVALSEEHGTLRFDPGAYTFQVGQRLDVVPVHVCTCVNLAEALVVVADDHVVDVWPVAARGHVW